MKPAPARLTCETPDHPPNGGSPSPSREARSFEPALIDEFCPLHLELQALRARERVLTDKAGRYETLRKLIDEKCDALGPENRWMLQGAKFDLEATPRQNEKTPNKRKLLKIFKIAAFLEMAQITQSAVKEALAKLKRPESECEQFFSEGRTGYRKFTVVQKS